jgi:ribosomal protein S6
MDEQLISDMLDELKKNNELLTKIEASLNSFPQVIDEKLKILSKNQGVIIEMLHKMGEKSIARSLEK